MNITDSVKTCINKYATFEGRATRSEYWWFWLAATVLSYVPIVGIVISLASLIPLIAVGVRRLHDTNHTGWWIICPIYNIVLLATKGDEVANKYGDVPADYYA